VHEPRVGSHVGGQYRRQPAFNSHWPFLNHRLQSSQAHLYDRSHDSANRDLPGLKMAAALTDVWLDMRIPRISAANVAEWPI
jgi:hypothetical protein